MTTENIKFKKNTSNSLHIAIFNFVKVPSNPFRVIMKLLQTNRDGDG